MKHEHSNYTLLVERVKDAKKRGSKVRWCDIISECHIPKVAGFRREEVYAMCDNRPTSVIAEQLKNMVSSALWLTNSTRDRSKEVRKEVFKETLFDDVELVLVPEETLEPQCALDAMQNMKKIAADMISMAEQFIESIKKYQSTI